VEWESSPAETDEDTFFTWIGGSSVRPMRPAFPFVLARLTVNGKAHMNFPLGLPFEYTQGKDGLLLEFEPRREQTIHDLQRLFHPGGTSGFYRLRVPGYLLTPGRPVLFRVELLEPPEGCESIFFVSPRRDALALNLAILRDEIATLQTDLINTNLALETLYLQQYPQLFPDRLSGERILIHSDPVLHYHPPCISALANGDLIITAREAFDHISRDGRIVLFRSKDGGKTWSGPQLLFDLGNSDHRCCPIVELPNGDWVGTDYRAGGFYDEKGNFMPAPVSPTLYGVWSSDCGKTWHFTDPLLVPGRGLYGEAERHLIMLPDGRLIVAANCASASGAILGGVSISVAVHTSDDNGRHWRFLALLPDHPALTGGEPTILHTGENRIIMLCRSEGYFAIDGDITRTGMLLQSESLDGGATWSEFRETDMSSMTAPAHLLRLSDGRILCSHAARGPRGGIYVTVSEDEGRTWNTKSTKVVTNDLRNYDSTYPTSAQIADGTIITVWYANMFGKFFIAGMRYRPEDI
jgi:hypothetical protein